MNSAPRPLSVLIADDHAIVRDGLRRMIEGEPDLAVAGEATDGGSTLEAVRGGGFDVLLLDMSMPGKSGIELIKQIRTENAALPILVLSMHAEEQYALRTIRAGAAGYLTKDSPPAVLITAIRKVASGGRYITAKVAEQLASDFAGGTRTELAHTTLSDREHEVFLGLVSGASVTELAESLHLSVKTVSTHKARVLEKMRMESLADLVRYAVTHDLMPNDK